MDIKLLQDASKIAHDLFKISIHAYDNNQCISTHFDEGGMIYIANQIISLMDQEDCKTKYNGLKIITSSDCVVAAKIELLGTDYSLVVGPAKYEKSFKAKLNDKENKVFSSNTKNYDFIKEVYNSMDYISVIDFTNAVSLLYMLINGNHIVTDDIYNMINKNNSGEIQAKVYNVFGDINYEIVEHHMSREYEKRLVYYISNGMLDELNNLYKDQYPGRIGKLGFDNLRQAQNMIETLNTLCIRAALDGGVDEEVAFTTGEIYVQKIESLSTSVDVLKLSTIIPYEYCKMVNDIKKPQIDDIIVSKAIKYIEKNIVNKISAAEIADYLAISKEYLSTKFKKVTNMSIPDYINEKKIALAKSMLAFTDKTLIEISDALSFSSQSYFQNIFKKIVKETPVEYRKNIKNRKSELKN